MTRTLIDSMDTPFEPDKRKEMVRQTRKNLDVLEDLTEQILNHDLEHEGWRPIIDYIRRLG